MVQVVKYDDVFILVSTITNTGRYSPRGSTIIIYVGKQPT